MRKSLFIAALIVAGGFALDALAIGQQRPALSHLCVNPNFHDGDTLRCDGDSSPHRILGGDTPENGPCRGRAGRVCFAGRGHGRAMQSVRELTDGAAVWVTPIAVDLYRRNLSVVTIAPRDGSQAPYNGNFMCAMIARGDAAPKPEWDTGGYTRADCPDLFPQQRTKR